jgi:hypothetical protein
MFQHRVRLSPTTLKFWKILDLVVDHGIKYYVVYISERVLSEVSDIGKINLIPLLG